MRVQLPKVSSTCGPPSVSLFDQDMAGRSTKGQSRRGQGELVGRGPESQVHHAGHCVVAYSITLGVAAIYGISSTYTFQRPLKMFFPKDYVHIIIPKKPNRLFWNQESVFSVCLFVWIFKNKIPKMLMQLKTYRKSWLTLTRHLICKFKITFRKKVKVLRLPNKNVIFESSQPTLNFTEFYCLYSMN